MSNPGGDEAQGIIAAIEVLGGEIGVAGEIGRDPGREFRRHIRRLERQHNHDLTFAMHDHIGIVEMTSPLGARRLPSVNSRVSRP